jgi:tetratricopeptide (TPR) repeat protein
MSATQAFLGEVAAREGQNRLARDLFGKSIQINTRNVVAQIGLAQLNYNARRFDEALVIYKRAQSLDPTDLRAATGLAATLIALGKPLDARKALQEIVRTAPDSPEVLYLQGLVDETVGNLDPAEAFYKATIKRSAIHFDAYHHLAAIYVKRAKHDEALKVLAQADSKIPSSPAVRTAQGEVLHAAKKLEQAQAKFEEALRLDANLNAAIFNLACVLIDRGKLSDGRDKLLALKAKDAEYPGLAAKLGDIHVRMKEYATAARAYDEALKVDATIEVRLSACRGYLLAGQHEKVLAQAAKVLELQPNSTAARALRAEARLAQARPDEALVEIRQALEREQKSEYSVVLGRVQEARGQKQEAIDAYTEALKGDPSLLEVRLRRGVLLVQTESVKEGQRELQAVLKANPGSAEAHYYVGVSLEDQRKEAQALAAYQAAVARDEKHAAAHFKIARLLSESPETKLKAVPHLAAAIKHAAPTEHWLPDAHFILGAIEEGRGQKKQALEAYKSYLCIAPPKAGARGEVEKRLRALGVEPREVECKPADKAAPPAKAEK